MNPVAPVIKIIGGIITKGFQPDGIEIAIFFSLMERVMVMKKELLTRLGFHYFSGKEQYTLSNVKSWFELVGETAQWVCLKSSCCTAISEVIFQFCQEHQINVLVQFEIAEWHGASVKDFIALLQYYKKQGVQYVQMDGFANQKATWKNVTANGTFLQQLSEMVLDFHKLTEELGFFHVLPQLVPGGDYWDLVVLKYLLQQFHLRQMKVENLVLSFVAHANGHPLLWGKGGKRKWEGVSPYHEKFLGEDHRGFLGFEWYQEIAMEILGKKFPVFLLDAGQDLLQMSAETAAGKIEEMVEFSADEKNKKIFSDVIGICLCFDEGLFRDHLQGYFRNLIATSREAKNVDTDEVFLSQEPNLTKEKKEKAISHYLLLPEYHWGISPWHLEVALPFIRKYRPTIGYSIQEAMLAKFVTVIIDDDVLTTEIAERLKNNGCKVALIQGDGMEVAAKLAQA